MRLNILHTLLALAVLLMSAPASGEVPAVKRPIGLVAHVEVSGPVVRLTDVFTGLPEDVSDQAIAYAPTAGKRLVMDARWLYKIADHFKLDWRPLTAADQVIVERRSIVIGTQEIEEQIQATLMQRYNLDQDMEAQLSNRLFRLHVPGDSTAMVGVEDLNYDPGKQRFTAVLAAPADDPTAKRVRVTGDIVRMIDIPVVSRRVLADQVIRADNVDWIRTRADRLQRNTITEIGQLVGMAPIRGLRAGIPVTAREIREPLLVKRGDLVTISLFAGSMTLTAQGKAMEDGSDGAVIRIENTRSKKEIEAVVTGAGTVAIRPLGEIAMSQE